jgi:hypothetical protein
MLKRPVLHRSPKLGNMSWEWVYLRRYWRNMVSTIWTGLLLRCGPNFVYIVIPLRLVTRFTNLILNFNTAIKFGEECGEEANPFNAEISDMFGDECGKKVNPFNGEISDKFGDECGKKVNPFNAEISDPLS